MLTLAGCGSSSPSTPAKVNEWTWESGASSIESHGVYGTLGVAAAGNVPGARWSAVSWTDSSGNLWLFGGEGWDSSESGPYLNDLWEFSPADKEWTWMSGANALYSSGVYGTQGVAAPGNVPGARQHASGWIDSSGNLWLFGGLGEDSTRIGGGLLNDLWEFNPAGKEWTWVSGPNSVGFSGGLLGVYGTQGVAAPGNVPGGRNSAVTWTDGSGNLWLFGGYGVDSTGTPGYLNDLWKFNPTGKEWTWVSGADVAEAPGVYGTLGVTAAGNVPGGRSDAVSWTDSSGNLWLFGGLGFDSTGTFGELNDLWEFNPTGKEWTWVSGANKIGSYRGQSGVYGTLGVAAAGNVPGGRESAAGWIDSSGNLWLFGGDEFSDLWKFDPTTKEWMWVSGSNSTGSPGVYGTLGVAAAGNVPGGRSSAVSWIDGNGNLWLFGGFGVDSTGAGGFLNDLWEYQP